MTSDFGPWYSKPTPSARLSPKDVAQAQVVRACPLTAQWITKAQVEMAWETEKIKLDADVVHKGVLSMMQSPDQGFYYVAVVEGFLLGCCLILKEWSDWRCQNVWWLHSVYVLPEYRKQEVFTKILKAVETDAKSQDAAGIRLYVDKTNTNAIEVYQKSGFDGEHYRLFEKMFPKVT
jgi:ribosomal protein S18 acetylase RimI-like enzyme